MIQRTKLLRNLARHLALERKQNPDDGDTTFVLGRVTMRRIIFLLVENGVIEHQFYEIVLASVKPLTT